jgi:RNA polymerase sigma-70 factor (ECF subfamily)
LQRARATTAKHSAAGAGNVHEQRIEPHAQVIASKFVHAWEQGDLDELLSILTNDAIQMMPPMLAWFRGIETLREAYAIAWDGDPRPGIFRVLPVALNGQLGFASYHRPSGVGDFEAIDLTVVDFTSDGTKLRELTSFVQPSLFAKFGLPERLPG